MKKVLSLTAAAFLLGGCSFVQQHDQVENPSHQTVKSNDNGQNQGDNQNKSQGITLQSKFFNQTKKENGHNVIQNPDNFLALVNKDNYLPGNYIPPQLVRPKVQFSFGQQDIEKSHMRKEAADALADMFNAAKQDGIVLYAASGYRSYTRQTAVFKEEVAAVGQKKADQAVAVPGSSEHQTGLAMDITCEAENFLLTEHFGEDKEGKWLKENAHKFGFILRYPKDKVNITNYEYEPWHFRYVGLEPAKIMYQHNWTLEEYFQHVQKVN